MKIEIEFEEVEALKMAVRQRDQKIKAQDEIIHSLDEDILKGKAEKLAIAIAKQYIVSILKGLGFKDTNLNDVQLYDVGYYRNWLGENWWKADGLECPLPTMVINEQFQRMTLKLIAKVKGEEK